MSWLESLPSGRVRAGYRNAAGRKIQRTFDYAFEAQQWLAAEDGDPTPPPGEAPPASSSGAPTLAAYAKAYVDTIAGNREPSTIAGYRVVVRHLEARTTTIGRVPVDELARHHVEAWAGEQRTAGAGRATIRSRMKFVRLIVGDAASREDVPVTYEQSLAIRGVRMPKEPTRAVRLVAAANDEDLLAACRTPAERAWVLIALDSGLRWGEAAALTAGAIDRETGLLRITQVVERETRTVRPYAKNGKDSDVVPIGTDRLELALADLTPHPVTGLLFASRDGRPVDYHNWRSRTWVPLMTRVGLEPAPRLHDLRHTYATRLRRAGLGTGQIKTLLRHADESTTLRYVHDEEAAALAAVVRKALQRSA